MALIFALDYAYYYNGSLYLPSMVAPVYSSKVEGDQLMIDRGSGFEPFEIKGVNLGLGKPGHYATEKSITKEEYLRWFRQIQDLGANVIRVYTLGSTDFYDAFYEYNLNNPDPLYLIHGVWVDDYLINSSYSALDSEFSDPFFESCKDTIDVIHGRYKIRNEQQLLPQNYDKDISPWVYGYILGIEWEHTLVAYTDNTFDQQPQYHGTYLYTEDGSNFEIFLAQVGDAVIDYETRKYGTQRVVAFSNWATTDPFEYPKKVAELYDKVAAIDVEHIHGTEAFLTGQFASYHIYPYYPDYFSFLPNAQENTYLQYLTAINEHHSMPVLISEFGVPSSRGMAAIEENEGRNQGFMSEDQQGQALFSMYQDIKAAGSAGAVVFTWQDEWFKRTWNTMSNVDLETTPHWSDYQTNEQYFGLLSFDPGEKESICYVDGDKDDWSEADVIVEQADSRLSMKYDEKFIYLLAEKEDFDLSRDKLYIPLDVTPKSGAMEAQNLGLQMSAPADFVIEINGPNESRIWVQERYDTTRTIYSHEITHEVRPFTGPVPPADSPVFNTIMYRINRHDYYERNPLGGPDKKLTFHTFDAHNRNHYSIIRTYETGKLLYGNANPHAANFNSLADFCAGSGFIEIKIPWGLLNFSDPSMMKVHDDYYEHLGIEYIMIDSLNIGIGDTSQPIQMVEFPLKRFAKNPKYHERLKESYYILQEYWNK